MAKLLLSVIVALTVQLCAAQYNFDAQRYSELSETLPKTLDENYLSLVRTFRNADTFPYLQDALGRDDQRANASISDECLKDYEQVIDALFQIQPKQYALEMIDSLGKPPPGILRSNLFWMGFFGECTNVVAVEDNEELFKGKYCKSSIRINLQGATPLSVKIGLCFPDSCDSSDAQNLVQLGLQGIKQLNASSTATGCVEPYPWRTEDIFALVLCGLLGLGILISTSYDVVQRVRREQKKKKEARDGDIELQKHQQVPNGITEQKIVHGSPNVSNGLPAGEEKPRFVATISLTDSVVSLESAHSQSSFELTQSTAELTPGKGTEKGQNKPKQALKHRLLMSFSALTNGQKLFNLRKNPAAMDSLNGIRAFSIAWVILGHTYNFTAGYVDNLYDWGPVTRRWTFQLVLNAFFAVDSFFFISGLLVAFGTLKMLKKTNGKMNWPMFYIHRYLRLTPVYAFLLLMLCTLFLHMLDGPFNDEAEVTGPSVSNCYDYWWTNLIYINNFLPDMRAEQCMGWTWYLANDMQFFFVSPIFLFALYKNRKVGYVLLSASLLSCMLANGIMAQKYDIPAAPIATLETDPFKVKYSDYMYRRPYYRIAPYIIGIALGDILFHIKDKKKLIKIPLVVNISLWVASIGLNWLLLYSQAGLYAERTQFEPTIGALYFATTKTAWALSLAYMVFACVTGYGGPINWFLSWRIWQPFARLSYSAYLIHPMVMYWYYASAQTPLHSLDYNYVYYYLGNMCLSFAGALIASLAVEAPFMRLENILLRR